MGGYHRLGRRIGAVHRPGTPDARCRSLSVHAYRRRSVHTAGRGRDGKRGNVQQDPGGCVLRHPWRRGRRSVFRRGRAAPHRLHLLRQLHDRLRSQCKNKLTANYLYLAEQLGVVIHELHEVYELVPLEGGGFEVHTRHPGWAQRAAHLHRHTYTAEQVIVAAHAYGSAKLLLHMQHEGRLTGLSSQLGQRARTNSEQILTITRPHGQWSAGPEKIHITPGSIAITSGVWPDAVTSIEPTIYGVGSNVFAFLTTYHQHGEQEHPILSYLKHVLEHPTDVLTIKDPRHWSERTVIMLCMQTTDTSIDLYWKNGLLRSRHGAGTPPPVHIPVVEDFVDRVAKKMDSGEGAVLFEVVNRNASAHFIGGIPIGDSSESGAVDPYQRAFGQPGLHVMDGSVMPANPGVNPSLLITALAERAMSLWPNKGDADKRPPLGAGYERVPPIMPHRPVVPAGAPGELRLDAKAADVIPEYPY